LKQPQHPEEIFTSLSKLFPVFETQIFRRLVGRSQACHQAAHGLYRLPVHELLQF